MTLWDSRVLRTRISRPVNSREYSRSVWSHILRNQLEVAAEEFWACVQDGILPDRGEPKPAPARDMLPLFLYRQLRDLGVPDDEIAELKPAEAAQRIADIYRGQEP